MKYLGVALLIAIACWFVFFRNSGEVVGVNPATVSPEQQFRAVLSARSVEASQLSALCSSYPEVGERVLWQKQLRITGTIAELRTSGLDGRRAEVVLAGGGSRKIVLICDLDQYTVLGIGLRYIGRFQVVGTELLYLAQMRDRMIKQVVTTQGESIAQPAALIKMGASWVEFKIVDGPRWAKAMTN